MKLRENSLVKRVVLNKIEKKLPIDARDEEKMLAIEEGIMSDTFNKAVDVGKSIANIPNNIIKFIDSLEETDPALSKTIESLLSEKNNNLLGSLKAYKKIYDYLEKKNRVKGASSKAEKNVNDYTKFIETLESSYDSKFASAPDNNPQPVTEQDEQTQPPDSLFTKEEKEDLEKEIKVFDDMLQKNLKTYPKEVFVGNGVGGALKGLEEQIAEKFAILTYEYFIQKAKKEYAERAKKKELDNKQAAIEKQKQDKLKDLEASLKIRLEELTSSFDDLEYQINAYEENYSGFQSNDIDNKIEQLKTTKDKFINFLDNLKKANEEYLKSTNMNKTEISKQNKLIDNLVILINAYPNEQISDIEKNFGDKTLPSSILEAKINTNSLIVPIQNMIIKLKTSLMQIYGNLNNLSILKDDKILQDKKNIFKKQIIDTLPKLLVKNAFANFYNTFKEEKPNFLIKSTITKNLTETMNSILDAVNKIKRSSVKNKVNAKRNNSSSLLASLLSLLNDILVYSLDTKHVLGKAFDLTLDEQEEKQPENYYLDFMTNLKEIKDFVKEVKSSLDNRDYSILNSDKIQNLSNNIDGLFNQLTAIYDSSDKEEIKKKLSGNEIDPSSVYVDVMKHIEALKEKYPSTKTDSLTETLNRLQVLAGVLKE